MVDYYEYNDPFIVIISREIENPIDIVFDAWLDSSQVGNWLFATPEGGDKIVEVDPRVGGDFIIGEKRGDEYAKHVGTYHEITRPDKIVFSYYYETENDDIPSNVIINFAETDKGCLITVRHEMDRKYEEYEELTNDGWNMIFDGLIKILN